MKIYLIIALSILLLVLLIMLACTFKVKNKIIEQFRCKRCLKINNILKSKCEYCREGMPKGYVYKSTFFGRRNCKNEQGYFDMSITTKYVKTDILIWSLLSGITVIGIIITTIFM